MKKLDEVRAAVAECFASDPILIESFHVASGQGLRACIDRTMRDVAQFDPTFQFFTISDGSELVAYWGTEFGRYINLIFVKPSHRNSQFMKKFWAKVQESVGDPFYSAVYTKNFPAVDFYRKRGGAMETFEYQGHWMTAFTFHKVGA